MSGDSNYSLLIKRLDQFIRKYYVNKALKGLLFFVTLSVALFLFYSFIEHQLYLSKVGRKAMFFSYILVALGSLTYWVLWPLANYFRLGSVISHDKAASIIGTHFNGVQDKLLNILQLKRNSTGDQSALIEASINQKAQEISPVPFKKAIDLNKNKKYLKYALPPLLLLIFILFAAPSLITDSTYRIINNNKEFEREAPFHLNISNENLEVVQFSDYTLSVAVDGEQLPNELFINVDNYDYRLTRMSPTEFTYTFANVREDMDFTVYSGKYASVDKTLKVLPKPQMVNFDLILDYPGYTQRQDETIFNSGDITVPIGTKVSWRFNTAATDEMSIQFEAADKVALDKPSNTAFAYDKRIIKDESYKVYMANQYVAQADSLSFFIRSIADERPDISIDFIQDSLEKSIYYFVGTASDDYGLTKLQLVYNITDDLGSNIRAEVKPIAITPSAQLDFDHILDINEINLKPGEKINYYFEVWDNDRVNGSKSARSSVMSFRQKSIEEVKEEEQLQEEEIKDKLDDSIKEAKEIQEELRKLREKLLQKEQPDWQDKKQLEKLMKRQEQLQNQMQEAKSANEKNLENQQEFMNTSPEMQEKQQRIQELFEEVVNEEMKDLMKEIEELMEELGKEQSIQKMEEFKMNEETMQKEMERLSELYKQLEVEKEMNEAMDDLDKLAEELDKLSEETKKEETPQEELDKKQEEINKEFEELSEKMDELMEKNDDLEFPKDIPDDAPEQMEDIEEDLEESKEEINEGENQKAASKQKQASEKMKKMSAQMKSEMMEGQSEQMQEDIETLRQLLENLMTLSFDQEGLVNSINRTTVNTPRYTALLQDQMRIKDDFKVVEDTLQALSKRQPDIETFVLEKVSEIKYNLTGSLTELEERKKPEANQSQRTTMTNMNDLALMLSESMEQMQQQMAGMMSGSQMCQNPGQKPGQKPGDKPGSKPGDKISEGQEKMSEELKKLTENMKNGKGNGAKDFAGAAARQAALRKALEKLQQEQQESGQGPSGQLQKIIDEMDKQEVDLVNKRLDNEMLQRQQDIMTRLLEAENAQKEREYDEKRKSKEGENIKRELPPSLEEYIKERKAQLEEYKYVSPEMKPHYKKLVDEYYKKLKRA